MKKNWIALLGCILVAVCTVLPLSGCMPSSESEQTQDVPRTSVSAGQIPKIPENLEVIDGEPRLLVYNVASDTFQRLDIETYIMGVVAGEMRNDWPMEALKAQAILARTYALKFCQDKTSSYGADISTDVSEAQAYDESAINDRVRRAVEETRGLVMSASGELPYAWFHAHAGGTTELASAALDYKDEEPGYTQVIESPESDMAPTAVKQWSATFTTREVAEAAAKTGVKTGDAIHVELGDQGESGRAITLVVNGKTVSAPAFRIAIGATKLKSTMLTDVSVEDDRVTFKGNGYGHGVGMSQWGAYGMAQEGKTAEEIVEYYFKNVSVVSMWD